MLTGTGRPESHHTVTHPLGLKQLDEFEDPWRMVDQAVLSDLLLNGCLHLRVASLIERDSREQVVNQGQEQRLVLIHLTEISGYKPRLSYDLDIE